MTSEAEELLASEAGESAERMALVVDIKDVGPCRKHVTVTVPESDIEEIREQCLEDLSVKAQVPGFRIGRAPRELLLRRFRDEITAEIKQKVLLASLDQLSTDNKLDPINEPKIDVESLEIPESGDFQYSFEVEVRPVFDLPDYTGLPIRRPSGEISETELSAYRDQFLSSYAARVPHDGPVSRGDFINCSMSFSHNGKVIREVEEVSVRVLPQLNFQDAVLEGFDTLMAGVTAGESRDGKIRISKQCPVVEMRGEEVSVTIAVGGVLRLEALAVDSKVLESVGASTPEELDKELKGSLARQLEFQQRQSARQQVLEKIVESADWDLPESLVRQQTENALRRELLEMQQAGFTREQVLARENEIRRNAIDTTRQALKEHFVLDRIATEEKIECEQEDIDRELLMMSFQSGEPVRRIRARLAKSGVMENPEAQLRERKAVDFILSKAKFQDVPREPFASNDAVGLRLAICGNMDASLIDDTSSSQEV